MQQFSCDKDEVDSICHELAYDYQCYDNTGHYSDAGYQSPGLDVDHFQVGPQGVFTPIGVQKRTCKYADDLHVNSITSFVDNVNNISGQHPYKPTSGGGFQKGHFDIDMPSMKCQYTPTATREIDFGTPCKPEHLNQNSSVNTNMKSQIANSDYFYVPSNGSSMMHFHKHQSPPHSAVLPKEENISPATISSGYSSDKDEALRMLDLEYTSDASVDNSPKLKHRAIIRQSLDDHKDNFALKPDEYYNNNNQNFQFSSTRGKTAIRYDKNNRLVPTKHTSKQFVQRSATVKGHLPMKSKDSRHNKRNSIALNPSRLNSLDEVNDSLSCLVINSSDRQKMTPSTTHHEHLNTSGVIDDRRLSLSSNDAASDFDLKLPEIITGDLQSFQHIAGIIMTPKPHCPGSFSLSNTPVFQRPSPNSTNLHVSRNSAFRPVQSANRSKSTPPEAFFAASASFLHQRGEGHDQFCQEQYPAEISVNCPPHLLSKGDSRVTSISEDSGRGSVSSFEFSDYSMVRDEHSLNASTHSANFSPDNSHIYANVGKLHSKRSDRQVERVVNQSHSLPPKPPKRNSRKVHRQPHSARNQSTLVKYEDIVKPQDIVDPSAMHMYTVADVLESVGLLSSDISDSSQDMCVHENYAHFVFNDSAATKSNTLRRSSSHASLRDSRTEFSLPSSYTERDLSIDGTISRDVPLDLSLPLEPHQNIAVEAQTKRLPKIKDHPKNSCNSPCVQGKKVSSRVQNSQNVQSHTVPKRRVKNNSGFVTRSPSVGNLNDVFSQNLSSISWSTARGNLTEVYC